MMVTPHIPFITQLPKIITVIKYQKILPDLLKMKFPFELTLDGTWNLTKVKNHIPIDNEKDVDITATVPGRRSILKLYLSVRNNPY